MQVLVIGAHGHVGQRLLPLLVEAGHPVRAMIRDPDQADTVAGEGIEPVVADLEDESLGQVFDGVDAVVFTAGSGGSTGTDMTVRIDGLAAIRTMDLAQAHGASRYVMVSSMGADDPDRHDALRPYLVAKAIADGVLRRSGLEWTILRPGALTDDEPTGRIRAGTGLGSGSIPRGDVAAAIVAALALDETVGSTLELLSGDEEIEAALTGV